MKKSEGSLAQQPLFGKIALAFVLLGLIIFLIRFFIGLGPTTNMSAGFPWGIWIAIDVVVGTAIGTGGFLMAILIYVFNKGSYHPLIRSAVMTSAFGYSIAGLSVIIDLGRWWNFYTLLLPWRWNTHSVLFEVAICILAYTIVLWLEFTPVLHEKGEDSGIMKIGFIKSIVNKLNEKKDGANKLLIVVITLGILLPIMHQSSLGTMMAIAKTKLHPLWHTPFLPILFLISIGFMGYSVVAIEALYSSFYLKRKYEVTMLRNLAPLTAALAVIWIAIRFFSLLSEGKAGLMSSSGTLSTYFWLEIIAVIIGTILMIAVKFSSSPRFIFISALFLIFGASLYRINVYIIGYNPGSNYNYVPSVMETMGTFALISAEFLLYLLFLRVLPILPAEHK